jgi:glucosamine-6-phosphate deaminase
MEIVIQPTLEAAMESAARLLGKVIRERPAAVLGLATGDTLEGLYRELVAGKPDWGGITTFNLDEYVGLPLEHPQCCRHFMQEHLFRHLNVPPQSVNFPDGLANNIPAECAAYERKIFAAGGIDLQLVGIGTGGQLGFNEPTSSLASRTRIKTLTPQRRKDKARFFGGEAQVPRHVITMGIGSILASRHCVMLAFGARKAKAVAGAVEGPITSMNPASALQLHPKATVFLDEAAAAELSLGDYYRWVHDQKPDWQKI